MRLRTHLAALVAAALLPVLAVSGLAVDQALSAYRRAFGDNLLDTSRALASAVERDLVAHITALETLATNPLLDPDGQGGFASLAGFHERAVRAAAVLGTPVSMIGADGRYIIHSDRPFGSDLPMTGAPDAVARVVQTARPFVGNLGHGAVNQAPVLPLLVPVVREGRVLAVLNSPTSPAVLTRFLAEQGLSEGRFAAAVDGNGTVVARSTRADEAVGRPASDWLLRSAAGKHDGLLEGWSTMQGEPVELAFRRLGAAPGWIVLVGEPRSASAAEARRPFIALGVGGGSALLLALGFAAWIGGRVLGDVRRLERQAEALAAHPGDNGGPAAAPPRPPEAAALPAGVAEFADLGRAMLRADAALRDREARQTLLVREVDHRAKNALAVVQSLVRLTPAHDPKAFQEAVQGRVAALARTHTALAKEGWRATDLRALLEAELAPHRAAVTFQGPPLPVAATAAQPIAMVAHELATNAAKHGALSVPGGAVLVVWWSRDDRVHLRWAERGGPVVTAPPARRGFGSRMIEANIKGQLGGTVRMLWEPSFACEVTVPLDRLLGKRAMESAVA